MFGRGKVIGVCVLCVLCVCGTPPPKSCLSDLMDALTADKTVVENATYTRPSSKGGKNSVSPI